eukprot:6626738-Alexandrium_andersonii.AAC.1
MQGNAAKSQVWARTPRDEASLAQAGRAVSAEFGHVLGMVWGHTRRSAKDPELTREQETRR